jgi:hypothetical protein
MDTLFPTALPTLNPTSADNFLNTHPDTKKGAIISFTVLGSGVLILSLIIYFFCRKNVSQKSAKKQNNKENAGSTNLPEGSSQI